MTYQTEYDTLPKDSSSNTQDLLAKVLQLCQSQSFNKLQNSYLQNVRDWAKIILKHSQREDILTVDAQHKALGAVTLLSLAKHRDYEHDHNFFPKNCVLCPNGEKYEDCAKQLWLLVT